MGCHFLLQEIFPTKESNPSLLHCRQMLYRLSYKGSPTIHIHVSILPQTPLPSRLHNIEQSSMCYTVGTCWLYILLYFIFATLGLHFGAQVSLVVSYELNSTTPNPSMWDLSSPTRYRTHVCPLHWKVDSPLDSRASPWLSI